jgi:protease-4
MENTFDGLGVQLMAMHEGYLQEHFLAITQPKESKPFSAEEFHKKHEAALQIGYDYDNSVYYIKANPDIALIPVIGATSKFGGWSSMGTQYLSRMLNAAKKSGKYKAILFYVDSPGGEVDGMKDWSDEIIAIDMPTLAFIDGYGASGGYWQAISADRVLANSQNSNYIGSIGVQTIHIDRREVAKTTIGDVKILRAKQSSMKNLANPYEELTKEAEGWIIDRLTETADIFISHVNARRPGIDPKSDTLKGMVYTGPQALDEGLIDGLATYDEAIAELLAMVPSTTTQSKSTSNSKTNANMKFNISMKAILAALGFAAVASEEEAPLVTEERLTALNAGLETANGTIGKHEATITQLTADLKTAKDSLSTAEADRDKYKADAEKYGKQAGAAHTPPKKDKPEGGNEELTAEEITAAEIAALPHNAALDSNPLFN